MVGCIFQGVLPTLCPFDFDVALPCYESCWEATTAFDCLQHLRARPQPISISNAIRQIWVPSIPNKPLFEASEFGMFVMICGQYSLSEKVPVKLLNVIIAIHSLLFQATKTDIGCEFPSSDAAFDDLLSTMEDGANLDSLLRRDFSGPSVVALADRIISTGGCPTLKKINGALDSWLAIWKLRLYREPFYEGSATIFDPLPFFWLAKLYTLLHHSEFLMGEDSEFGVSRVDFADTGSKLGVQSKIIRWLSKLTNAKCRLEVWLRIIIFGTIAKKTSDSCLRTYAVVIKRNKGIHSKSRNITRMDFVNGRRIWDFCPVVTSRFQAPGTDNVLPS